MNRVYKKSIMYAVCAALLFAFLLAFANVKPVHAAGNNAKNYLGKAIYTEDADSDQATWFSGAVGLNYTDGTSSAQRSSAALFPRYTTTAPLWATTF